MAGPEVVLKKEKNLGVPVEVQSPAAKKKIEELRKITAQFVQLDRELSYAMKQAKRDPASFFYAMQYEADRSEQGGNESFKLAYRKAFMSVSPLQIPDLQKGVINKVDFTEVSRDSFLVYLYFSDRPKALKLSAMFLEAWRAHDAFVKSITQENLGEQLGTLDAFWDAKSSSFRYQSDFSDARQFVDSLEKPSMPRVAEPVKTISEQTGSRLKYHIPSRPAIGHELLANPSERVRYFDPTIGNWLDKGSIDAMKRGSSTMSWSDTIKILPLVGPIIDVKKKIDEIIMKGKIPLVRTWDVFEKKYVDGKARVVQAYEISTWMPAMSEFGITYREKKPGEKPPVPEKVFDPEKKKMVDGKVAVVEALELTAWNPFKQEFEKRVTEKPKAGVLDYVELVAYIAMATLDGIFITQTVGRTAVRGAGAKAFIARTDQELYVSAMGNLDRSESVRLLNIAREKRSWGLVASDLRKMAKGGEVTTGVMKKYIEKEWGGSIGKRMLRRTYRGTTDFFGNALAPVSRGKFQARMVAEFFNEMRHTTDFKAAGEIMKSLRAAGLSPAQERLATRAVFSTLTSFSRKTQRLFLAEVSKPYSRKTNVRLHEPLSSGWVRMIQAIEKEGVEAGIARIVPYYSRAKGYGPSFRAMEFIAYMLVVPAASKKPLEALGKHLENKMQIKAQEIEDKALILELSEQASRVFPRRPGAE